MLGKLIKHEWKSVSRVGCLLLGAMALITFFGWLGFQTPMWNALDNAGSQFGWLDVFGIMTLMLYVVMLVAVNYGILAYLGVHFYKTMYADEGYLTHTLPVTKHQILLSKILVSSLWMMILILSVYLSLVILGLAMLTAVMPKGYPEISLWRDVIPGMRDILYWAGLELGWDVGSWVISVFVTSMVSPFATVTILFGAISIGQLFTKFRILMAIVTYVGILVAQSVIGALLRSILAVNGSSLFGTYMNVSLNSNILINCLAAVALYFVAWYITGNKLNME